VNYEWYEFSQCSANIDRDSRIYIDEFSSAITLRKNAQNFTLLAASHMVCVFYNTKQRFNYLHNREQAASKKTHRMLLNRKQENKKFKNKKI